MHDTVVQSELKYDELAPWHPYHTTLDKLHSLDVPYLQALYLEHETRDKAPVNSVRSLRHIILSAVHLPVSSGL